METCAEMCKLKPETRSVPTWGATLDLISPSMANSCQLRPMFGKHLAELGRSRTRAGQTLPMWAQTCRIRVRLDNGWRRRARIWPSSAKLGGARATVGQSLARLRRSLANVGHLFTTCGRLRSNLARIPPSSVKCRPNVAEFCLELDHVWPTLTRICGLGAD